MAAARPKCTAITIKGTRCKNNAKPGMSVCGVHEKSSKKLGDLKKSQAGKAASRSAPRSKASRKLATSPAAPVEQDVKEESFEEFAERFRAKRATERAQVEQERTVGLADRKARHERDLAAHLDQQPGLKRIVEKLDQPHYTANGDIRSGGHTLSVKGLEAFQVLTSEPTSDEELGRLLGVPSWEARELVHRLPPGSRSDRSQDGRWSLKPKSREGLTSPNEALVIRAAQALRDGTVLPTPPPEPKPATAPSARARRPPTRTFRAPPRR